MDYYKALEILEIDISKMNITDINMKKLKKKYHKLALQHHPDKNGNTTESNEKFKKIQEAYEYLKNEMKIIDDDMDSVKILIRLLVLHLILKQLRHRCI